MKKKDLKYILIILLVSIAIMLPKIVGNYQINDDTEFHITNILATESTMDDWLPDDILPDIFGKFGYATRQFYPLMAHTVSAYIGKLFSLNVVDTLKFVHTLILFLSGLTMYFLALRYSKKEKIAVTSAVIYMLLPYHLSDIYLRDALAECFVYIFIPLILDSLTYLFEDKKKFIILFCLGYIGGMLSHLVMMVYFTVLLIPFFIIYRHKIFNKKTLLTLGGAALIILGIMSPVIVNLMQNKASGLYEVFVPGVMAQGIWHAGLSLDFINYFYAFNNFRIGNLIFYGSDIRFYFDIISLIMLGMVIFNRHQYNLKSYQFIIIFGLISLLGSSLLFPWDLLPQSMRIIQFPWRLEAFSGLGLAMIAPLALEKINYKNAYLLVIMAMTILGLVFNISSSRDYFDSNKINYERGMGWQYEYLPIKTLENYDDLKVREYKIFCDKGNATIINDELPNLEFSIDTDTNVEIPRTYYLGYTLFDSNNNVISIYESDNGLIASNLSEGTYTLKYTQTKNVRISEIISLIFIIFFTIFCFLKKNIIYKAISKISYLYHKYAELINYGIFGVLTTVLSLIIYYLLTATVLDPNNAFTLQIANIISWIGGVTFAYITNRKYVFASKNKNKLLEATKFVGSRTATLLMDMAIMAIGVTLLHGNDKIIKLISQVVVIICNYIFSKLIVFKTK
jgi:putative flippase GtrA